MPKNDKLKPSQAQPIGQNIEIVEPEQSIFPIIRQGTATNALTKTSSKRASIDKITGTATITQGDFVLTIPNFEELTGGLRTSALQLLDALTIVLTESGAKSPNVALPLDKYIKQRGLSDRKATRKQSVEDLDILYNVSISYKEKRGKKEHDFFDIRICDAKGIKNGIIHFSFGRAFYNILLGYPIMPYPPQLLKINANKNPESFRLLRKIGEHKNMNVGKKNEDIIAVKTLLSKSNFPTYEEVMSSDRHLNKRIIEPFERDMNALRDTFDWEYCHSNNTPLTDEELFDFSYSTFEGLLIKVYWHTYPDPTARLEAKAQRDEISKKKKRTPSNPSNNFKKTSEESTE